MIRKRLVTVITALVLIAALGFPLLSPTVALADIGDIPGGPVIDTLEFETEKCEERDITHVSGDVYAMAYKGKDDHGHLQTVTIATDGTITLEDNEEFDSDKGKGPDIIHVSGDVYAIAYKGKDKDGFLQTVTIATDGTITLEDNVEFDTDDCHRPDIIHVSGDVYAIAYKGKDKDDGYLKTVEITTTGDITEPVIDTFEFETVKGKTPNIIHVSSDVYAIAYSGDKDDGYLKTVEITTTGDITEPVIDTFEFETVKGKTPDIIHVSGDVYAIAYEGESGQVTTVEITTTGDITEPVIDTFEFETVKGKTPDIIHISGDVY
ncbi:unnamed protein product, partial [marine sediment metagenome]